MNGTLPGPWKARLVMRGKDLAGGNGQVGYGADLFASGVDDGLPDHLRKIEHVRSSRAVGISASGRRARR